MNTLNFIVNDQKHTLEIEADEMLSDVLRYRLGLTGTKFGCGIAACGACTVHVNGRATRSCVTPVSSVEGADITTIEGLAEAVNGPATVTPQYTKVQQAWIDHQVPQCGYCQLGMIMAVTDILANNPNPSDEDIDRSLSNICRCGSTPRVRKAIRALATA